MSSLQLVRTKSQEVFEYISKNASPYWTYNRDKLQLVAEHIEKLINRDYQGNASTIPPHSRLRHHSFDSIEKSLEPENLLDMIVLSTILDAGAGDQWKYKYTLPSGEVKVKTRSEGIAQAVEEMHKRNVFGNCTGDNLEKLTLTDLETGFQVSNDNPMTGLEGRIKLLHNLGRQLNNCKVFTNKRPSGIIKFIKDENITKLSQLWEKIIIDAFAPIFPQRDEWLHRGLNVTVPFHKLLQWLAYTLVDSLSAGGIIFERDVSLTGLPEYRNGGIFVDSDVLTLKQPLNSNSLFKPGDDLVIEWRCATVVLIDKLHDLLKAKYGDDLELAQVLEAGTWKAGREMAALLRPTTKSSPIPLVLDGTIF